MVPDAPTHAEFDAPYPFARLMLDAYLAETTTPDADDSLPQPLECYASGRAILAAEPCVQTGVLIEALSRLLAHDTVPLGDDGASAAALVHRLCRFPLVFSADDLDLFVTRLVEHGDDWDAFRAGWVDPSRILVNIAWSAHQLDFAPEFLRGLQRLRSHFIPHEMSAGIYASWPFQEIARHLLSLQRDHAVAGGGGVVAGASGIDPATRARAHLLLERYLIETHVVLHRAARSRRVLGEFGLYGGPAAFAAGRDALAADAETRFALVDAALRSLAAPETTRSSRTDLGDRHILDALIVELIKSNPHWAEPHLLWLLTFATAYPRSLDPCIVESVLNVASRSLARSVPSPDMRAALVELHASIARFYSDRTLLAKIERMLGAHVPATAVDPADDWGYAALAALDRMEPAPRARWEALLRHGTGISGAQPSRKWNDGAQALIDALGDGVFAPLAAEWLRFMKLPSRGEIYRSPGGMMVPSALIADHNANILKGLAWCCALVPDEELASAVGDAAIACFRKIPEIGARSTKAGNAFIGALGAMFSLTAVAQLQRVSGRVKLPSAQKTIEKALAVAATRHGLTRDDLDDLALPTFGLVNGKITTPLGEIRAEVAIAGSIGAELRFLRHDGKVLSGAPAEVRREFPGELKQIRQALADVRAALAAQRARLERLFLDGRTWPYDAWRERYLDQPLLAHLTRRLIWTFDGVAGIWSDGAIVDINDAPLEIRSGVRVSLWHPIGSSPDVVLAWRAVLERNEITQPFKQAHREVYLLTDAERATATHSNRFAAHVLRQHQFQALCRERGWEYRLRGMFDGDWSAPALRLDRLGLRAEFVVEETGNEEAASRAGIYVFLTTFQVRFTSLDARPESRLRGAQPVPLMDIAPTVFSEVMRDVDLFVGVCSIGADPGLVRSWRRPG